MKKTQKQIVIDRLNAVGYVDNFWAIQNYILRLGSIIYGLKEEGWQFDGHFGYGQDKKNFYYYKKAFRPRQSIANFPSPYPEKKAEAPQQAKLL